VVVVSIKDDFQRVIGRLSLLSYFKPNGF